MSRRYILPIVVLSLVVTAVVTVGLSTVAHAQNATSPPSVQQPETGLVDPSTGQPVQVNPYVNPYQPNHYQAAPRTVTRSYRTWMMGVDGIAWAALLASPFVDQGGGGVALLALGGLVLGGPIVHFRHGQFNRGMVSLLMRLTMPVAGVYLGVKLVPGDDEYGDIAGGVLGGVLAMAGVQLLDSMVFSKYEADPITGQPVTRRWAPTVTLTSRVKTVGVMGRW